jgi:4-aminobutyrate aminotransferase-like enzyme
MLASRRIDDVDSVFKVPSRINSTWGGNLTDMVRATKYLQIIDEENLLENTRIVGDHLLAKLNDLRDKYAGKVTNSRGRGVMCAFRPPDPRGTLQVPVQGQGERRADRGLRCALGALPSAPQPHESGRRRGPLNH